MEIGNLRYALTMDEARKILVEKLTSHLDLGAAFKPEDWKLKVMAGKAGPVMCLELASPLSRPV